MTKGLRTALASALASPRGAALLALVPTSIVVAFLVDVVAVVAARMQLPFDIDWIEGGQLQHARRIATGLPLFGASDGFLPHPYPPLHAAILALAGRLFGLDHATGRGLSALAWAATGAGLLLLLRRAARLPIHRALLAVALVGALLRTYPYARGWFDLVRIDSMATLLAVVAALPLAAPRITPRRAALAGALSVLALYAKQTNVFLVAGVAIVVGLRAPKRLGTFAAFCVGPSLLVFAVLDVASRGAFHRALLATSGHAIDLRRFLFGLERTVAASPTLLLTPVFFGLARGRLGAASLLVTGLWLGAIPAALLPLAKRFGAENNLIPLFTLSAALPVFVLADALRVLRGRRLAVTGGALGMSAAAAVLCLTASFDPAHYAPSARLRREVVELLEDARALPGRVVAPVHPFMATQIGRDAPPSLSWLSYVDAATAGLLEGDAYARELGRAPPDWLLFANMPIEADLRRLVEGEYVHERDLRGPAPAGVDLFYSVPRMAFRRRAGGRTE